jgi:hypothetical protein
MGYDAPESALPGSRVPVTLYWLAGGAAEVAAFGETRSLGAWPVGALAPQTYLLEAPSARSQLSLIVETGQPARCGWLRAATNSCDLGAVELAGQALPAGAVNYADQLVLRTATLETAEAAPGDEVRVVLEWQGLRTMTESYTVFVHLVGPDGRLHGQRDYWPVEGTRLTTTWQPGEIIHDPYRVTLDADAPSGDYAIHIGLYLPETLERVSVLSADGQPLDDKFVLAGPSVR